MIYFLFTGSFVLFGLPTWFFRLFYLFSDSALLARGRWYFKAHSLFDFGFLYYYFGATCCVCISFLFVLALFVFLQFFRHEAASKLIAKCVVSINLLELWAETFFSLRRREHLFKFLNSFSDFMFIARIVSKCYTEEFSHFSKYGDSEVTVFVETSSWSEEGRFESKWIDQLELFPHHHSACRFFLLLNLKVAVIKVKELCVFVVQKRENSFF